MSLYRLHSVVLSLAFLLLFQAEDVPKIDVISSGVKLWWRGILHVFFMGSLRAWATSPILSYCSQSPHLSKWSVSLAKVTVVLGNLERRLKEDLDVAWASFATLTFTKGLAELLSMRAGFYRATLAASQFSRLVLSVFLLALSFVRLPAQLYTWTRSFPHCRVSFSFVHFPLGRLLGSIRNPDGELLCWGRTCSFCSVVMNYLSFPRFGFFFCGGQQLTHDEDELSERIVWVQQTRLH
jgi:hypothetical protein